MSSSVSPLEERTLLWDRLEEKFVYLPDDMALWVLPVIESIEGVLEDEFEIKGMEWGVYVEEGEVLIQPERFGDVHLIDDLQGIYVENNLVVDINSNDLSKFFDDIEGLCQQIDNLPIYKLELIFNQIKKQGGN